MAVVTVHSDFGAQENKSLLQFSLFPLSVYRGVMGPEAKKITSRHIKMVAENLESSQR